MEDKVRLYSFFAAALFILACLTYVFICIWIKPAIDLTVPVMGIITFLLGFYYGSSKSSQDKSDRIEKVEKKG